MPETIGRYQIEAELGRGGMATVYLAQDPRFGRRVAVKILPRQFLHDPTFRGRFEREARIIANLEHPAIAPVYDFGDDKGQPFLVMRYMPGGTLAARMTRGPLPIAEIVEILRRLGSALDYAHSQGIIHRDLKPANILFDGHGNAFLSDFGIVKLAEATVTYTGGGIVGTPSYMSPEQIHGDGTIDGRSDVYSLGVIAFEMLTGRAPYKADTPMQLMMKHILEPVPQLRDVNQTLPAGYQAVVDKAMAKNRDARFETAGALAEALNSASQRQTAARAALSGGAVQETLLEPAIQARAQPAAASGTVSPNVPARQPIPKAQPPSRVTRRRTIPTWGWLLGCLVVVGIGSIGALTIFLLFQNARDEPPTRVAEISATPNLVASAQVQETSDRATAEFIAQSTLQAHGTATAQVQATLTTMARATATARALGTQAAQAQVAASAEAAESLLGEARSWPLFFLDSFQANEYDWCVGEDSGDLLVGDRRITDGEYWWEAEAIDDFVWWCAPEPTELSGDFYAEVEGELVSGPDNGAYGLVVRRLDNDNYYLFRIQNNGWFQFLVRFQDEWTILVDWQQSEAIAQGDLNRLSVVAQGIHYSFFINDVFVAEVDDDSLSGGRIGLASALFDPGDVAVVVFDNLEIRTP